MKRATGNLRNRAGAVFALSLGLGLGLSEAGAKDQVYEACAPGSADHTAAEAEYGRVSAQIEALRDGDPVEPANTALEKLRQHPCFRLSEEAHEKVKAKTARMLRTFWSDGGDQWIRSYLHLRDKRTKVVLPPDLRKDLSSDGDHGKVPVSLLCPMSETRCGQETAGWMLRAERLFDQMPKIYRDSLDKDPEFREISSRCLKEAQKQSKGPPYVNWYGCIKSWQPQTYVMPLGSFRAPQSGWWVLRGRRGHYQFCDEIRAYDLASGAAYVISSCSGLVLGQKGTVLQDQTDAGRKVTVRMGRVPVESLREAALMTVLADDVQRVDALQTVPLPAGLAVRWTDTFRIGGFWGSGTGSSGNTTLSWIIGSVHATASREQGKAGTAEVQILKEGTLTWPSPSGRGEQNAVDLLAIAEAGMQDGCPPAPLPERLPVTGMKSGVSRLDASPESLRQVGKDLESRLVTAARELRCTGAAPAPSPAPAAPVPAPQN